MESVWQSLEGDEIILIENGTSGSACEICINYSDKYSYKKRMKKTLNSVFFAIIDYIAGDANIR